MKSACDINGNSGERTLAACWSPHSAATNFLEMQNYSFGQEFSKSSFRQNAEGRRGAVRPAFKPARVCSVRCPERESPRKLKWQ
jgi:hypothetical protein